MPEDIDGGSGRLTQPGGPGGVFLTRGMRPGFPAGGIVISIGDDGAPNMKATMHLAYEVYVNWLEIAFDHLDRAERAHERLRQVWNTDDGDAKGAAIEEEFAASLQCVVAAAVAVDAFYAWVRPEVTIPQTTLDSWRRNRTARHRQISEVFKRAFCIGPKTTREMQDYLGELFKWRGWAVHPSAGLAEPVWYDELQVATEWRLNAFRAENARGALSIALSVIVQLPARPRPKWPHLVELCAGARSTEELLQRWEMTYGQLYERQPDSA